MRKIVFFVFAMALLFCCKDTNQSGNKTLNDVQNNTTTKTKAKVNSNFYLDLEINVVKEETFRVYYGYIGETFTDERVLIQTVAPSKGFQNLHFVFPQDELPQQFRIHIGDNKEGQKIILGGLVYAYGDSKLTIRPHEFYQYFITSPNMPYDVSTHTFNPLEVEGRVFDPHFLSNQELVNKLLRIQ